MNITLSPLIQNKHVCGFLFNSIEIDSLQQFKEAILNDEATINYSRANQNLLIEIDGKEIQCPKLSNRRHKKLHDFLCRRPELCVVETGEKTSFVLITKAHEPNVEIKTLFSTPIEIMIGEKTAA